MVCPSQALQIPSSLPHTPPTSLTRFWVLPHILLPSGCVPSLVSQPAHPESWGCSSPTSSPQAGCFSVPTAFIDSGLSYMLSHSPTCIETASGAFNCADSGSPPQALEVAPMLNRSLVVETHFLQLLKNAGALSPWPACSFPLPRDYTSPVSFRWGLKASSLLPSVSPGLSPKTVLYRVLSLPSFVPPTTT